MNPDSHNSEVRLPTIEPSADFVRRVTNRVAELETIRRVSRTQRRRMRVCVWACALAGAFLGWALTAPLLPPLWAAYYTLRCFAATLVRSGIEWWLPLAAIGIIGVVELAILVAARFQRVPALPQGTQA
jgi:CHASE2 domain-containing sensor protein